MRLAGHGLRYEGSAYTSAGVRSHDYAGPGMGLCECGLYSSALKNRAQRQRWHAAHRDDVRGRMTAEAGAR